MPVVGGSFVTLFSDLDDEVILRLENRTSDLARASVWLKDSLLEISGNPDYRDDFTELESLSDPYNLTIGTQEYNESNFTPPGDVLLATLDLLIWVDPPGNTKRKKLEVSHYQFTDRITPVNGLPVEWYRFGGKIGFHPVPDKAYQTQTRALIRHPIQENDLPSTEVLLPREWNEILIWASVMRGFMELNEFEKAAAIKTMIYGDPEDPKKPGLIYSVKRKRQKEVWRQTQPLQVKIRPYMYGQGG
jgi:hypothetical protein